MIRIASIKRNIFRKTIPIVIMIAILGWAYLWYFGLPPYYGLTFIYPGKPDARLNSRIARLMAEIRKQYPDPELRTQVRDIAEHWSRIAKRPGVALSLSGLGLGAVPYVEEMTRVDDAERRLDAYYILADYNVTASCLSGGRITNPHKEWVYKYRYINPIMEKALYDPNPKTRRLAIKFTNLGARGVRIYYRMLRDPDPEIRITAARELMWRYERPDLVPKFLQNQVIHGEAE